MLYDQSAIARGQRQNGPRYNIITCNEQFAELPAYVASPAKTRQGLNPGKDSKKTSQDFQRSSPRARDAEPSPKALSLCEQEGQAARTNPCTKALLRVHCPHLRQLRVTAMGRPARRKSLVEHPGDALVGRSVVADGSIFHESPTQKFPGKVTGTSETSSGKGLNGL